MFVGHFSPSYALRRASGGVPLWALFLSAQFVDVLWAILVMAGVEGLRITPGFTASNALDLYYMPYTHSLAASVGWALLVGAIASRFWGRRGALVVGLCVLSHWVLDLPVHVADLPLWGDQHKVGLGLWNRPVIALLLEVGVFFLGVAIYARHSRHKAAVWIFSVLMLLMQMTSLLFPHPSSSSQMAGMALSSYLLFAAGAWWVEKKWGQLPIPASP